MVNIFYKCQETSFTSLIFVILFLLFLATVGGVVGLAVALELPLAGMISGAVIGPFVVFWNLGYALSSCWDRKRMDRLGDTLTQWNR